ncbi:MAG: hypothetical protein N2595_02220 [bacterium]|nr:hypothetical protein [bacterium]
MSEKIGMHLSIVRGGREDAGNCSGTSGKRERKDAVNNQVYVMIDALYTKLPM